MTPEEPQGSAPFSVEPVPPDLLAWARPTIDQQDFWAQLREVEATGGYALEDFLAGFEARARER